LTGIAYTLLTGAQVPTVRACIAAILVLIGIALGREALSLRLVAVGALIVLLFKPEALAGASFQLSFAAVTTLVALYQLPWFKRHFERREEGVAARLLRALGAMLLTGLAVEIALMPMALYHFHKAGLYGVLANLVAIPLTTFVVMPLEACALLLDAVGLGAPLWVLTGWAIGFLLWLRTRSRGRAGRWRPCRPCRVGPLPPWCSAGCGCACGPRACAGPGSCPCSWERSPPPLPRGPTC
jgi:competence protein ComEC